MLTKPKVVAGAVPNNTRTFYCAPDKWKLFQAIAKSLNMNASEFLRKYIDEVIIKYRGGELKEEFDLETKKAERIKWKRTELNLVKLLEDELIGRQTAYEVMVRFALGFGADLGLEKNLDKVLVKLQGYDLNGEEPFSGSTFETFIEYVEAVLARRKIEAELKQHRRQKLELRLPVQSNTPSVTVNATLDVGQ
jgi:hypothetical protein